VRDPLQTIQWWKDFASIAQSFGTVAIAAAGGWWAYWKFGISQNRYPHIETSADIQFIGVHGDYWIIELLAYIENKGTAQHRMKKFDFELSSLNRDDQLKDSKKFGGQVYFPNLIKKGSFLANYEYFVVDAGVKAKYSYITRAPTTSGFLILHVHFEYSDQRKFSHAAERTVVVPSARETTENL
jgi:hypothetical protein